jgi:hypothetical protein
MIATSTFARARPLLAARGPHGLTGRRAGDVAHVGLRQKLFDHVPPVQAAMAHAVSILLLAEGDPVSRTGKRASRIGGDHFGGGSGFGRSPLIMLQSSSGSRLGAAFSSPATSSASHSAGVAYSSSARIRLSENHQMARPGRKSLGASTYPVTPFIHVVAAKTRRLLRLNLSDGGRIAISAGTCKRGPHAESIGAKMGSSSGSGGRGMNTRRSIDATSACTRARTSSNAIAHLREPAIVFGRKRHLVPPWYEPRLRNASCARCCF